MFFRHIDEQIKWRAVELWERGWDIRDIEDALGVKEGSVRRWRNNVDDHGSVKPPRNPLQGRPQKLSSLQVQYLVQTISDDPGLFLDEIQELLSLEYDVALSKTRIHQLTKDAGLSYKLLKRCAVERDDGLRAEFLHYLSNNITAEMVIAVDETSKDDRTIYRHYGRAPHGYRAQSSTLICPWEPLEYTSCNDC